MRIFDGLTDLADSQGEDLGASDWIAVDQPRIDAFADVTGDHQWIHVDPDRAASGPFGRTVAHGYLTLSLLAELTTRLYRVDNVSFAVNYGLDRVRFVTPVLEGSRIRATARLAGAARLDAAVQVRLESTIEIEGSRRPAAVVTSLARYFA
ncbi:MaoC family dehydratase [Streptomyces sp. CBMA29]|uniref:MaoC family dehydratase n=1 Tax=Streptomyces sp. CBMA29 TaxID=1896314 RepID=UPI001661E22A|nr:MaoC family dehydratase [Streptomyces sp. CBMA29]MBD0738788.1 dehydratase [Streptomyces sp. CBMA29]